MSDNPILDELYAIREQIWKECGGTMDGLFAHYSKRGSGMRADPRPAKPRRPRVRPPRASSRKNNSAK